MGKYLEFPNSCFVDTLDNIGGFPNMGSQANLFGLSTENAIRIKRQNEQKISVVIGNPPYNANQANFNDFNKNREYDFIDKRIKDTYVNRSNATNKANLYDMYTRFYRWASDRVDENGVVCMVTNNSFINNKAFDGFRKSIQEEFDFCYVVDLGGNIRELSGKDGIFLGEAHTVFGLGAMVGIAIMFLVKSKEKLNEKCQIKYIHPCDIRASRIEKFEWLEGIQNFGQINFDTIIPDKNNNWIDLSTNDFDDLISLNGKKNALFNFYSLGVNTNRDEWVFDFDKKNLKNKMKFFVETYNSLIKNNSKELSTKIKWSSSLENYFQRKLIGAFSEKNISYTNFRPFTKKFHYKEKIFNHRLTQNHYDTFGNELDKENLLIGINVNGKTFDCLISNRLLDLHYIGDCQYFSIYKYDQEGNRHDNITDWGLSQFTSHYQDSTITKEDIFYYTYAVLHNPEYRKKYELNLKRDFPRLPFYEDFFKWVSWGKQLMELHINYETVAPFELQVIDNTNIVKDKNYKLKVKLKADKPQGVIAIDEHTYIHGVPDCAWAYKLGNRSAIEWVLDQYKEKKYTDKTIAENFNTYRFADYKNHVIDLLKRVCTVSVETVKIIEEMDK